MRPAAGSRCRKGRSRESGTGSARRWPRPRDQRPGPGDRRFAHGSRRRAGLRRRRPRGDPPPDPRAPAATFALGIAHPVARLGDRVRGHAGAARERGLRGARADGHPGVARRTRAPARTGPARVRPVLALAVGCAPRRPRDEPRGTATAGRRSGVAAGAELGRARPARRRDRFGPGRRARAVRGVAARQAFGPRTVGAVARRDVAPGVRRGDRPGVRVRDERVPPLPGCFPDPPRRPAVAGAFDARVAGAHARPRRSARTSSG